VFEKLEVFENPLPAVTPQGFKASDFVNPYHEARNPKTKELTYHGYEKLFEGKHIVQVQNYASIPPFVFQGVGVGIVGRAAAFFEIQDLLVIKRMRLREDYPIHKIAIWTRPRRTRQDGTAKHLGKLSEAATLFLETVRNEAHKLAEIKDEDTEW
jgi:hypothetical protein